MVTIWFFFIIDLRERGRRIKRLVLYEGLISSLSPMSSTLISRLMSIPTFIELGEQPGATTREQRSHLLKLVKKALWKKSKLTSRIGYRQDRNLFSSDSILPFILDFGSN